MVELQQLNNTKGASAPFLTQDIMHIIQSLRDDANLFVFIVFETKAITEHGYRIIYQGGKLYKTIDEMKSIFIEYYTKCMCISERDSYDESLSDSYDESLSDDDIISWYDVDKAWDSFRMYGTSDIEQFTIMYSSVNGKIK